MLELVDESLEAFFRASVPLSAVDIDVSFEPPEREWSAKLTRPTVSLFLWDIRRSSKRSTSGIEDVMVDGVLHHRPALPWIELRYLITAWTADHGDERRLLSGLMRAVLANSNVPKPFVPEDLAEVTPVELNLSRDDDSQHVDVFKTLEGQLKPGLNVLVTLCADVGVAWTAAAPIEAVHLRSVDLIETDRGGHRRRVAGEILDPSAVGARVRGPHVSTSVNEAGNFLISAAPGDEIVIDMEPPRSTTVPEQGGIRLT